MSDGGVHNDDPGTEELCFIAATSDYGNSEQGTVSLYKCPPFFLLQLICGLNYVL